MSDTIQIIIGTLGLIVAVIAIFMTRSEIKAQNKQCLFDQRTANYVACKKFYNLVRDNFNLLKVTQEKDEPIEVATLFSFLMNCTFLEEGAGIINDTENLDLKKKFLRKIEYLITVSEKSRMLFPSEIGEPLGNFVFAFQDTLIQLYKYQVLLELIRNFQNTNPAGSRKTFSELAKMFNEHKYRRNLKSSFKQLRKTFNKVKNEKILDQAQKETRLFKR